MGAPRGVQPHENHSTHPSSCQEHLHLRRVDFRTLRENVHRVGYDGSEEAEEAKGDEQRDDHRDAARQLKTACAVAERLEPLAEAAMPLDAACVARALDKRMLQIGPAAADERPHAQCMYQRLK